MTSEIPTDYYIIVSKFLPQRNKQAKAKKYSQLQKHFGKEQQMLELNI